jgi:hypothetical protein
MEERLAFKCWNAECQRQYTLFLQRDVGQAKLIVECPYCNTEAEVDLAPWRTPTTTILRGGASEGTEETVTLPDVLPTTPRKEE